MDRRMLDAMSDDELRDLAKLLLRRLSDDAKREVMSCCGSKA